MLPSIFIIFLLFIAFSLKQLCNNSYRNHRVNKSRLYESVICIHIVSISIYTVLVNRYKISDIKWELDMGVPLPGLLKFKQPSDGCKQLEFNIFLLPFNGQLDVCNTDMKIRQPSYMKQVWMKRAQYLYLLLHSLSHFLPLKLCFHMHLISNLHNYHFIASGLLTWRLKVCREILLLTHTLEGLGWRTSQLAKTWEKLALVAAEKSIWQWGDPREYDSYSTLEIWQKA